MAAPSPTPRASLSKPGLMRLVREFGRPYWVAIAAIFALMATEAVMTGAVAYLLDPAIKYLFIEKDVQLLYVIPVGIALLMALKAGIAYTASVLLNHVGLRMIGDLQHAMFDRLMRFDLAQLNAMHSGQFASAFLNDAVMLRDTISRGIQGLARDILTLIGLGAVMYYQDWRLALVATTVLPAVAFYTLALGNKTAKASHKSMAATGELSTHISESLDGRRVIKAYGMEKEATDRAGAIISTRHVFLMKGARAKAAATPAAEAAAGIGIAVVVGYAGYQSVYGTMGLNNFVSFLGAMMMAYQSVRGLSSFYTILAEGEACAQRTFALMDTPRQITDAADARTLDLPAGLAPAITFDNVVFRYRAERAALNGLHFELPAGKTVALVGPSGAGKSTILNLLLRFYDVDEGAVRINGEDLRRFSLPSLRQATALVTQEPFLFDDTIASNISVGRPGASMDEIRAAAKAAAADGFIMAQPQGYEARVGEGGLRLSGGQRQRIAIARAMLKDAPILLLDEATSSLDSESERDVQTALRALMQGRSTLVIAHRLSTIMDADLIVVIDGGRVAEQGQHAELLARGGAYARLYRAQFTERPDMPQILAGV
ncbi:MAG TPA: ABC transporter permease [Alphaproteobacteria bacterium]|nr:ABC transporter permease [Alphaproteobacteria bacterium]